MTDQLRDIWQDLRAKRLWPIAVVLALAIVAVPVLLTKSAAQPPTATVPPPATPQGDDRMALGLDGGDPESSGTGSSLGEFTEGDPFTPPGAIASKRDGATSVPSATAAGPTDDGGQGPINGDPGSPSPGPGPPIDVAPQTPQTRTETAEYEYVADVTLWTGDSRRGIRGLHKLDMLPNQSAPVLIFMGTSGQGGNAVFLVDSTLTAAGEGRCVPSAANCTYVHIGPGSEHAFSTEEGDSYRVRVDEIHRVKVSASAARSARPSARKSVGAAGAVRRFQLPSLADLVAVRTTETAPAPSDSSAVADGR